MKMAFKYKLKIEFILSDICVFQSDFKYEKNEL